MGHYINLSWLSQHTFNNQYYICLVAIILPFSIVASDDYSGKWPHFVWLKQ